MSTVYVLLSSAMTSAVWAACFFDPRWVIAAAIAGIAVMIIAADRDHFQ